MSNPRIYITVKPETDAIFDRMAHASGLRKATIVSNLLQENIEELEKLATIWEQAVQLDEKTRETVRRQLEHKQKYFEGIKDTISQDISDLQETLPFTSEEGVPAGRAASSPDAQRVRSAGSQPPYINKGAKQGVENDQKGGKGHKNKGSGKGGKK